MKYIRQYFFLFFQDKTSPQKANNKLKTPNPILAPKSDMNSFVGGISNKEYELLVSFKKKMNARVIITNEINVVFSLKCLNNIARTIITIIIHWGLNKGDNPKNIKLNIIFSFKKKYEPIRIKK